MMQEFGTLDAALAAAIGDDAVLRGELRAAFLSGAAAHLETLAATSEPANWQATGWRLHGLAASFGALDLMNAAADAAARSAPDPDSLARLRAEFARLAG